MSSHSTRLSGKSRGSSTRTARAREATVAVAALGLAASLGFLLARTLPDVAGKPWQEDEAVAGLISARPLGDVLQTVLIDRGGAPLHFVLAHAAFAVDGSPRTLRWLSLVFALATVPLCYDLARRVAGQFAALTAAALTATSSLLTTYATFGRMYALFAFASALALDLFVRAVQRPARATISAAVVASVLVLAVHPFGVFVFGAELVAALWLWRWRALPIGLVAVPFALAYVRLHERYDPDAGMSAPKALLRALGGSAGGHGLGLLVFAALALVGAHSIQRAHAVFALGLIVVPPLALAAATNAQLSPRHLIFVLPVWTTLVAAGIARMPARIPLAAAAVAAAAVMPSAVADPRTSTVDPTRATAWVRAHVRPGDALYPYATPFVAALPQAAVAQGLPREPVALSRALRRTTSDRTLIALPGDRRWTILAVPGPFTNVPRALAHAVPGLHGQARAAALQLYATSTEGTSPHRSSSR